MDHDLDQIEEQLLELERSIQNNKPREALLKAVKTIHKSVHGLHMHRNEAAVQRKHERRLEKIKRTPRK